MHPQVVNYFALVDAAQTATPPPGLLDTSSGGGGGGSSSSATAPPVEEQNYSGTEEEKGTATTTTTSSSSSSTLVAGAVAAREAEKKAERKAVEAWRRKLLKEMLRSELGFNTVVKDSGLIVPGGGEGAGLGLFVEGSAPEGAVVAIYPVREREMIDD